MLNSEIGQKPKLRIRTKVPPAAPKTSTDRLASLVASSIASDPHEVDGNQFCKLGRIGLAAELGVHERTITRLVKDAPFVSRTSMVDGERTLLVRIGEPSIEDQARETGIVLTSIWRKHLNANLAPMEAALKAEIEALKATLKTAKGEKRKEALAMLAKHRQALDRLHIAKETPAEFGLLVGLAGVWPEGLAVDLFKLVLAQWGEFMCAVKIAAIENPPQTEKTYVRSLEELHFKFPNLRVLRLFAHVAVDMLVMKYQAQGPKACPPSALVALNPSMWKPLLAKKG